MRYVIGVRVESPALKTGFEDGIYGVTDWYQPAFLPSSLPADAFGTPKRLRPNTYLLPVFHNISDGTAFVQQLSCRYRHIQDDTPYVLVHGTYLCPPAAAFRFYLLKADTKEFPYTLSEGGTKLRTFSFECSNTVLSAILYPI